jgi:hypothetical protein
MCTEGDRTIGAIELVSQRNPTAVTGQFPIMVALTSWYRRGEAVHHTVTQVAVAFTYALTALVLPGMGGLSPLSIAGRS